MKLVAMIGTAALLLGGVSSAAAPKGDQMAICAEHLQVIGRALVAYRHDHGDLPAHLSDLYPHYVTDRAVFHCPADPSPGNPRFGLPADPRLPISYLYRWGSYVSPSAGPSEPLGEPWILAICLHHYLPVPRLTWKGQVFRSEDPSRQNEPWFVEAAVERMEHELSAGVEQVAGHWRLGDLVELVAGYWNPAPLPPALRHRMGEVADRLLALAKDLPVASQSDAYRLVAHLYRGAGLGSKAAAAADRARDRELAAFLAADLRYRSDPAGRPPVDEYLKLERARKHIPGMSVAVLRNDKVVMAKGYGMVDRERSVPATKDTVYGIASIGKTVTATGIMLLVEAGKLSLADPISKFLPEAPPAWHEITVRHLLTHTSGIPDATVGATTDEVIQHVAKMPMKFAPGEQYAYSNAGYTILGRIIEQVSGKPLDLYLDERIYRPLQMNWTARGFEALKNVSTGYQWEDNTLKRIYTGNAWVSQWLERPSTMGHYPTYSTVLDLAKFITGLSGGKLLKPSSLRQMWVPTKLTSGQTYPYGMGWELARVYRGHSVIYHGGGSRGISGILWYVPEAKLGVILLSCLYPNLEVYEMAPRIADYFAFAPRPLEDQDATAAQRLKRVLRRLAAGQADPREFTSAGSAALSANAQATRGFYQSQGPLKSFSLIERTIEGKNVICCYRAVFGQTAWVHRFVLAADGKIVELGVQPQ